jgi:hypothetical protein
VQKKVVDKEVAPLIKVEVKETTDIKGG